MILWSLEEYDLDSLISEGNSSTAFGLVFDDDLSTINLLGLSLLNCLTQAAKIYSRLTHRYDTDETWCPHDLTRFHLYRLVVISM